MAFFNSAVGVLQTLVIALGAGLGVWGVINLMEGYGNDNPGAKSQGIGCKQEIVVQMDDEKIAVLQNRRGVDRSGHAGCVMVSKKRNKPPKILINTEAPAVNY